MKFPLLPVVAVAVFVAGFAAGRWTAPSGMSPVEVAAPSPPPSPVATDTVAGTVVELHQVPNYTYLRLTTSGGDVWAAVPTNASVRVGDRVSVLESTRMTDFTSKALGRTFPSIVFGDVASGATPSAPQLPAGHPSVTAEQGTSPVATALDALKQTQPPLALRVSDVHAEKAALAGQVVTVRGTLTRVTAVQGLHFAHLDDGSGANDLIVMSQAPLTAAQAVTVRGRVVLDKDVGIGPFPVALEAAQVQ